PSLARTFDLVLPLRPRLRSRSCKIEEWQRASRKGQASRGCERQELSQNERMIHGSEIAWLVTGAEGPVENPIHSPIRDPEIRGANVLQQRCCLTPRIAERQDPFDR